MTSQEFGRVIEENIPQVSQEFGRVIEEDGVREGLKAPFRIAGRGITSALAMPAKTIGGGLSLLSRLGIEGSPGRKAMESAGQFLSESGSTGQQTLNALLEKALGGSITWGEKALTGVVEKVGESLPWLGGGILSKALRSGGSAVAGQTAEELGAPQWLQSTAEIVPFGLPGLGKEIAATQAQKPLVDFARGQGLTEAEIAPLIQSERKQKWLSKLAIKNEKTKEMLEASQKAVGNIFGNLRKSPEAKQIISPQQVDLFTNDLKPVLKDLPAATRELIAKDAIDLSKGGITGDKLINFWQDVNDGIMRGHPKLGALKDPIKKALSRISPELGKNFELTNALYSNYAKIRTRLKPTIISELFSASVPVKIITGIASGAVLKDSKILTAILMETVGEAALKRTVRNMLLNPRLQNLSKKMIQSLNSGKFAVANKLAQNIQREVGKESPEIEEELEDIDFTHNQ